MKAVVLRLYMHESRRFRGMLLYEWLLEQARKLGVHGGSAFRAVAGYGRHGVMHEQNFFELAGELPVVTEFIVGEPDAERILALVRKENIDLMYVCWPAEFSTTAAPAAPVTAPAAPAPPAAPPAPSASPGGTL
jgi:PII-like signaling protein